MNIYEIYMKWYMKKKLIYKKNLKSGDMEECTDIRAKGEKKEEFTCSLVISVCPFTVSLQ